MHKTSAGVGKSNHRDAFSAGIEAAQQALTPLDGAEPQLLLVFATTGYNQQLLLDGVREVMGNAPLCGCSGEGVISREGADEHSHAATVMAIAAPGARFDTFSVGHFNRDSKRSARTLASAVLQKAGGDSRMLLLFPSGNIDCETLLETLDSTLPQSILRAGGTAGCVMADDASELITYQYHAGLAYIDSVSAVLISGELYPDVGVSHGCTPIGLARTVTEVDGGTLVKKIDGRPAFEVLKEYLDDDPQQLSSEIILHLCVGLTLPEQHHESFGKYVIRTPLGLRQETGALEFPGGGFRPGSQIKMTRRDALQIRESALALGQTLAARHPERTPAFVLQCDCAGRGRMLFGASTTSHTVEPLREALGTTVPWIGLHTHGEIAPLNGKTYYHNYTVALCAFYDTPLA